VFLCNKLIISRFRVIELDTISARNDSGVWREGERKRKKIIVE